MVTIGASGMCVIGRHPQCDLRGDSLRLSRHHASAAMEPDGSLLIRDLGSTNGTRVNGQRVMSARIRPGDEVQLGGAVWLDCERSAEAGWRLDLSNEPTVAREVQLPAAPPQPEASVVIPQGAIVQVRIILPAGAGISENMQLPQGMELIIGEPEPPAVPVKGTDEQAARPDLQAPAPEAEEPPGPGVSQHRTIAELREPDDDVNPSNPPAANPSDPPVVDPDEPADPA